MGGGQVELIGRERELDDILAKLAKPELNASFVITGPAGVGKTRFASELADAAEGLGLTVARVFASTAAATIPFAAFAPVLPPIEPDPEGRVALLQRATTAILARAEPGQRVLVVVDDAQWLDEGSATLVHQLAHSSECSLLVGVRTPGQTPDPVTSLWRDALAERVDLQPLSEPEVGRLAATVLAGAPTSPTVRWLFETSGGNPMFVRELINGAVASGSLSEVGGVWIVHLPVDLPQRLTELVQARLNELAPRLLELLELVAVGEAVGLELLVRLSDEQTLEEAERGGMIAVRTEGRRATTSLAHPLYGEVLRQQMGVIRRRRLAATLAEALESTPMRRHDDALHVARWQLDAGIVGDPGLLARAARRAREMFDMELAIRIGNVAQEAGADVMTCLALAEALFYVGHHQQAEDVLVAQVSRCSNDDERSAIARARTYNFGILMGDMERATQVIDEALVVIRDEEPRLTLLSQSAVSKMMAGDIVGALSGVSEIVSSSDQPTRLRGTFVQSWALAMLGRTVEAVRIGTEARELELAQPRSGTLPTSRQMVGLISALAANGQLDRALELAAKTYETESARNDNESIATLCLLRGWLQVEIGDLGAAALWFRAASAIVTPANDLAMIRWCLGGTALAEGMAGRAAPALAAMDELAATPDHWPAVLDSDLVARGLAWARAAAGETTAARAMLLAAADEAASRSSAVAEARLLHDIVRLGDARGVARRLKELAEVVDGSLVTTFAVHAAARASGRGQAVQEAGETLEEIGARLAAAEAFGAAAAAFTDEGLARRANAVQRHAAELMDALGVASTLAPGPRGVTSRLTKREAEVARFAAAGLSSPEIAERLYVSLRTVHSHLQHIYTKLGVTSRAELASLMEGDDA